MIAVVSNFEDFRYLIQDLNDKSDPELMAIIGGLLDLRLQRRFIIYDSVTNFDFFGELCKNPLVQHYKTKGYLYYRHDDIQNHYSLSQGCRVVELNDSNDSDNIIKSKLNGHICLNIRDRNQLNRLGSLFLLDTSFTKGYVKDKMKSFPRIDLPVRDIVIFDPYFGKHIGKVIAEEQDEKFANGVAEIINVILNKQIRYLVDSEYQLSIIVNRNNSPFGLLNVERRRRIEELVEKYLIVSPRIFSINVNGELHDRGIISDYYRVILTNSLGSAKSIIDVAGLLCNMNGYFAILQHLNNLSSDKLVHLSAEKGDLGRALGL